MQLSLREFGEEYIVDLEGWHKDNQADQYMSRNFVATFNGRDMPDAKLCNGYKIDVDWEAVGTVRLEKTETSEYREILGNLTGN